jgi:hypothetical protein
MYSQALQLSVYVCMYDKVSFIEYILAYNIHKITSMKNMHMPVVSRASTVRVGQNFQASTASCTLQMRSDDTCVSKATPGKAKHRVDKVEL